MDADFSVRNEVDSINPPQGEDFKYNHQTSPYDDIVSGINNAPPFPSAPFSPFPHPSGSSPYISMLHYQLGQQQILNHKLIEKLTREDPIPWKYLAITLGAALIFLLIQKTSFPRRNPRVIYVDRDNDY